VQPLVSILLPAFNTAATLSASLRSIQRQTETRWECVLIDDGSEDDTLAAARAFAERDERFVIIARPHRGIVAALNSGLEHCRGEYIARMDADDLMHRARLAAQVQALEAAADVAAVGCHVRLFPRAALRDGRRRYERWLNAIDSPERVRHEAFVECPVAHPTLMVRREVLVTSGYRDVGWPEDYDLVLRLLARGKDIAVVPRRLLCWRDGAARLSRANETYCLDRFTTCKAAFLAAGFLAASETYTLWGYGETGRALRGALLAHGKHPTHIVEVHRGRMGNIIHGAPVVAPEDLPRLPRQPVVASVAGEKPRRQIRAAMAAMGFLELRDFVCAA
jgi:glycosyltransferase involved in cell wall biosynthesis